MTGRRELATASRLEKAASGLSARTIDLPELGWVRGLDADVQASVGLVVKAGIDSFVAWIRDPGSVPPNAVNALAAAPRAITRRVSLAQALDLFRASVRVVEESAEEVALSGTGAWLKERLLVYSREVALAIAGVYAAAAEEQGAWGARLQALIVEGLFADEPSTVLQARATALGWEGATPVVALASLVDPELSEATVEAVQRLARRSGLAALAGMRGDALVVLLGGSADPFAEAPLLEVFGDSPIVTAGPAASLATAGPAARDAVVGLAALPAWPQAPRPVAADDLLPERALAGDVHAQEALARLVHDPLDTPGGVLLSTLGAFLEEAASLEACARSLYVHANTVRYRLQQVLALTGLSPHDPRDAFTLRCGLVAGRLRRPPP